jgi:hypothetical protein
LCLRPLLVSDPPHQPLTVPLLLPSFLGQCRPTSCATLKTTSGVLATNRSHRVVPSGAGPCFVHDQLMLQTAYLVLKTFDFVHLLACSLDPLPN